MNTEDDSLYECSYLTENDLQKIREWSFVDAKGLMSFCHDLWSYPNYWVEEKKRTKRVYRISTAGWSGNESIIKALTENHIFWTLCWWSSRRGGHYVFKLSTKMKKGN